MKQYVDTIQKICIGAFVVYEDKSNHISIQGLLLGDQLIRLIDFVKNNELFIYLLRDRLIVHNTNIPIT